MKTNSAQEIYEKLVAPVCALEEYCSVNEVSPILDCIAMALRLSLDFSEIKAQEDRKNG